MPSRTQITLAPDLDHRAKRRAADLGISFAEYVRRLIALDLDTRPGNKGVEQIFGIGDSGGADVARKKDEYLDEAFGAL